MKIKTFLWCLAFPILMTAIIATVVIGLSAVAVSNPDKIRELEKKVEVRFTEKV